MVAAGIGTVSSWLVRFAVPLCGYLLIISVTRGKRVELDGGDVMMGARNIFLW